MTTNRGKFSRYNKEVAVKDNNNELDRQMDLLADLIIDSFLTLKKRGLPTYAIFKKENLPSVDYGNIKK